jgi:hypothetical protein
MKNRAAVSFVYFLDSRSEEQIFQQSHDAGRCKFVLFLFFQQTKFYNYSSLVSRKGQF